MLNSRYDTLRDRWKRNGTLSNAFIAIAVINAGFAACDIRATPSWAQAIPPPGIEVDDNLFLTVPEPSHDEWRQRVDEARQRAREAARQRRENPQLYMPAPEDPEITATERVLNDDSLRPGDIVATKKGIFRYQGRPDRPRREDDFVLISPHSR